MPADHAIPRATGWRLHTPNALVILRLLIATAVFAMLQQHDPGRPQSLLIAAALFILAATTDALDGILARRWNAVTRFGRVMDPFADKILVLGALVLMTGPSFAHPTLHHPTAGFQGWMVVIILGRELLVTSLRGLAESAGADASANWAGKAKMILQSVSIPAILITLALTDHPAAQAAVRAAAWATTIATAASAVPYITRAIRPRREP